MKCIFSILTEDNPGVLTRIASLVYRRGYNIVSLSVGTTHRSGVSRFTVVIEGDEWASAQVEKQLTKLVEVLEIENLSTSKKYVERKLCLIKVATTMETLPHVLQMAQIFRCRVVDTGSNAVTLEATGNSEKIEACIDALHSFGIIEVAESGSVAVSRVGFKTDNDEI